MSKILRAGRRAARISRGCVESLLAHSKLRRLRTRARTLLTVAREEGSGVALWLIARKVLSRPYRAVIPGGIPYESAEVESGFGMSMESELRGQDDRELWHDASLDASRIAGVVVLFNPDESVVQNIHTYANQVATLFAVDNSDSPQRTVVELLASIQNVQYSHLGRNRGVAAALNLAALKASDQGYDFLLTMDQDSKVSDKLVVELAGARKQYRGPRVAIVAAVHLDPAGRGAGVSESRGSSHVQPVLTVITSGNLLNLRAWREVGGFADDLFIDQVDSEFCLRLHRCGYEVLIVKNLFFQHTIGNIKKHRIFRTEFYTSNHSPVRKYYIVRNRLLVRKEYRYDYPAYGRFELGQIAVETTKIILFENQRYKKLLMMLRGFGDYWLGVSGQYRQKQE